MFENAFAAMQAVANRHTAAKIQEGADILLIEPWRFERLLPGTLPTDPADLRNALACKFQRERRLALIGHYTADLNAIVALQQALEAARDERFPTIWAHYIRDRDAGVKRPAQAFMDAVGGGR